jgi:iron complex outermembrane receptor protein
MSSLARRAAPALAAIALVAPSVARAAGLASCTARADASAERAPRRWSAPLDRKVSLQTRELSLRDALDRLAAAARIRLSYATELVPLDRRVCDAFDGVAAGDVLVELLRGTTLEPVVVGDDQVVLAPSRRASDASSMPARRSADVLERVVVTGSATGAAERPLTVALDVVSGRELERRGATSLAAMLDAAVPGVWMWEQSPSSLIARYGSIRGASSFSLSYPKVYIDGIEVANPLLVTQLAPESVERVEVIRGPQGAALYGADAISGVVNIVTRHDGVGDDGRHVQIGSGFGMSRSDISSLDVLTQRHTVALRAGSGARSGALDLSLASIGDFVPDGSSRQLAASGALRLVGARTTFGATARLFGEEAGVPRSPTLPAWTPPRAELSRRGPDGSPHHMAYDSLGRTFVVDSSAPQSVRQYTLGATATFAPDARWTHAAVVGLDGYRLANVAFDGGPIPSATDSALRAARGSADRVSARVSSVARLGHDAGAAATLTFAAEHSALREATAANMLGAAWEGALAYVESAAAWRTSSGLIAQADLSLRDALFVTGGLRLERDAGYTVAAQHAVLPMLGAAWVRDLSGATLKLRAAYGKGIRPPRVAARDAAWMTMERTLAPTSLAPESQAGTEAGADLLFGRAFALHLTRFDQRASGLIQAVAIARPGAPWSASGPGGRPVRRVDYELQNVGEITNRGWEMQGTARSGALALTGALSLVESRVARVTAGYTGDLRAGDRTLEVPARTASLTASWTSARWYTAWTVARAADWINYDRLALARDLAWGTRASSDVVGTTLRSYWRDYAGVTHLRASLSRDLGRGVAFVATGDNLLNRQHGEPDDMTIVPGRTLTGGVRVKF